MMVKRKNGSQNWPLQNWIGCLGLTDTIQVPMQVRMSTNSRSRKVDPAVLNGGKRILLPTARVGMLQLLVIVRLGEKGDSCIWY